MESAGSRGRRIFAAVDVHYQGSAARAALVAAADPAFADVVAERTADCHEVRPYRPGEFYLRELPPIRAVIGAAAGVGELSLVVVDGYVDLDAAGRPGLGARVHAELGVPVIGVAKTPYRTAVHAVAVLRGKSASPLFVTAAGMSRTDAARMVREMTGQFRLPDALRRADALARRG